jgi:hypothetical protein
MRFAHNLPKVLTSVSNDGFADRSCCAGRRRRELRTGCDWMYRR